MKRAFLNGFLIGLLVILLANLAAAQLRSDCGLPALFGLSGCADDISRAGFPLIYYEDGGFAYHHVFNLSYLLLDIFIGLDFATMCGFFSWRRAKLKNIE
jgi:hypothetical protein